MLSTNGNGPRSVFTDLGQGTKEQPKELIVLTIPGNVGNVPEQANRRNRFSPQENAPRKGWGRKGKHRRTSFLFVRLLVKKARVLCFPF